MGAIRPEILTWARETAGLSLEDAARMVGLKKARGETGAERLAKIEETGDPPRSVLLQMARVYRRPLLVFYLNQPPRTGDRGQDFRTLPGEDRQNPDLDALIRDIRSRQGLVRSVLEDEEAERPGFVGAATMEMPVGELAGRMAENLRFSLSAFRDEKTAGDAFGYLRGQIESAGVFVLLLGNLGSYHSNIPVEFFRGFAIADPLAPMIVINDQDARTAWSFTALHELVHLWLGTTGISGTDAAADIEQYCNDVAGEILLPAPELKALPKRPTIEGTAAAISEFAEARRVSRAMVAYKLFRSGRVSQAVWRSLDAHFRKEWLTLKQRQAEKREASEGGPSYYVVKRHRVGDALLGLMRRALDEGAITYTKAGRVLGVKPTNVQPLLASGPIRGFR
jgi:Zn-dependent peptidase ImmA (M78 family)/transcriptional regulator with XRE-family HTH domain